VKELSKDVELLGRKFSDAVDAISSKYEEYARRYGELKAECGKLEEELRLARVIQALNKYPSELKELQPKASPFKAGMGGKVYKLCMF
jgi:SMC interacting uncharacterized protein involved in chromosome segregation